MSEHDIKVTDAVDDGLIERSAQLFDESVQRLDGETRSRLNIARQAALCVASEKSPGTAWQRWGPAVAATSAAVVLLLMWSVKEPENVKSVPLIATDFEILVEQDNLEMLEELEFF
ncbi:MAG: hypothetical protein KDI09_20505, partial [Halioglobus sp.]|nr:hypothetical protein [Halioglobus sp.]